MDPPGVAVIVPLQPQVGFVLESDTEIGKIGVQPLLNCAMYAAFDELFGSPGV